MPANPIRTACRARCRVAKGLLRVPGLRSLPLGETWKTVSAAAGATHAAKAARHNKQVFINESLSEA